MPDPAAQPPEEELNAVDGCIADLDTSDDELDDDQVTGFVLFADIDPDDEDAVAARELEWEALANLALEAEDA